MMKRKCEEFVESNIKGYDVAKHFYKEHLVAMTIRGNLKGKDVYIYDEYHMDAEDDDERIVLGMNTLEKMINDTVIRWIDECGYKPSEVELDEELHKVSV